MIDFGQCPRCQTPLALVGTDDDTDPAMRGTGGHFFYECPTHGRIEHDGLCPACGSQRVYTSFGQGLVLYCWSCRKHADTERIRVGAAEAFGDLIAAGYVKPEGDLTERGLELHLRLSNARLGAFVWGPKPDDPNIYPSTDRRIEQTTVDTAGNVTGSSDVTVS